MTRLRLVARPGGATSVSLDGDQRAAIDLLLQPGARVVAIGEPGSGKSTLITHAYLTAVKDGGLDPDRVWVVSASRDHAAQLRDSLTRQLGGAVRQPHVSSAASAAFALLRADAVMRGEQSPSLITGAEQDVELAALLQGHREGIGRIPDWTGVVPEGATALPGFRSQLRDLLMRAAEAGLAPADVEGLGHATGRPEWIAAASIYQEYLDVMALRSLPGDQGRRVDPAAVVAAAAHLVEHATDNELRHLPACDLLLVDDSHDATAATMALVRHLVARGASLLAVGNADQAVQSYRGAVPLSLSELTHDRARGGVGATLVTLSHQYRWPAALAAVNRMVASRIGVTGSASARHGGMAAQGEASVRVVSAAHRFSQARKIAGFLREKRHESIQPRPWSSMAVIARSRSQLRQLRADLTACDIPCQSLSEATALNAEPAVWPLLQVVTWGWGADITSEQVLEVLGSRYIGLDAVAIRSIRRHLVAHERATGGERGGDVLLVELVGSQLPATKLPEHLRPRVAALVDAVARATEVARGGPATPGEALWAVWEAWGAGASMRTAALSGSARDDTDLDAVMALFKAAQTFVEKLPHASPLQFVDYVASHEFAVDTLGQRGTGGDTVALCTPASAAGSQWDVVVVAGVEEGAWPNTALRDSVLGAQHLADIVARRVDIEPLTDSSRLTMARLARKSVIDDETRAFYVAISRASSHLLVTGTSNADTAPSRYLDWVSRAAGVEIDEAGPDDYVGDLRTAVTRLRILGEQAMAVPHAHVLAHLARFGAGGAHPGEWHGVAQWSTVEPVWLEDDVVPVSPSSVETIEECPLSWALTAAGGRSPASDDQSIGTLVHEIASEFPHGGHDAMLDRLSERWHEVADLDQWQGRRLLARAQQMVTLYNAYCASVDATDVRVEQALDAVIGKARIRGRADRVEVTDGVARVIVVKSGSRMPTVGHAATHGQLAMYQLAVEHGGVAHATSSAGAALIYVTPTRAQHAVRSQGPIDPIAEAERLEGVVAAMRGPFFVAQPGDQCSRCPVQRACPAHAAGRQVSEP